MNKQQFKCLKIKKIWTIHNFNPLKPEINRFFMYLGELKKLKTLSSSPMRGYRKKLPGSRLDG